MNGDASTFVTVPSPSFRPAGSLGVPFRPQAD
jgi:hypothetical protein